MDGGLGYNNPIQTLHDQLPKLGLQGLQHSWKEWSDKAKRRVCYLSIGTGRLHTDQLAQQRRLWRRAGESFRIKMIRSLFRLFPQITPAGQVARYLDDNLFRETLRSEAMEENAHRSFQGIIKLEDANDNSNGQRYFRFNCDAQINNYRLTNTKLDGWQDLNDIQNVTLEYLNHTDLTQCVNRIQMSP